MYELRRARASMIVVGKKKKGFIPVKIHVDDKTKAVTLIDPGGKLLYPNFKVRKPRQTL